MDFGAALIALTLALVFKLSVMTLAAVLLIRLQKTQQPAPTGRLWLLVPADMVPHVRVLWWSLILFYVGELSCGVEVYILFRSWDVTSCLHSIASASGMALFAVGFYTLLDQHHFHYGEPGCVLRGVCGVCTIRQAEGCKFRTVVALSAAFVALASLGPMTASTDRMPADLSRWALPWPSWNAWYDGTVVPLLRDNIPGYTSNGEAYALPSSMLFLEFRLIPVLTLATSLLAVVLAARGREVLATRLALGAAGALAFSYFELVLYAVSRDVLMGSLAHEAVELWFLIFVAEILRRAFPRGHTTQRA